MAIDGSNVRYLTSDGIYNWITKVTFERFERVGSWVECAGLLELMFKIDYSKMAPKLQEYLEDEVSEYETGEKI